MTKLRDGYFRQINSKVGDDNYLLKARGGYIGLHTGRNNEANKVVRTDENGYIQTGWINTTSGSMDGNTPARIYASYDGYIRYMTPGYFFSNLSNSGNNISITVGGQNRTLTVGYASNAEAANYLNGYTKIITVNGDINTYYPVKIPNSSRKSLINTISVWRNLGGLKSAIYPGSHGSYTTGNGGGVSCWYEFVGRYNGWDGNGGYYYTRRAWYAYDRQLSHAAAPGSAVGDLFVWLRGGGTEYYVSTNYPFSDPVVYYERTNASGSSQYPSWVEPRTDIGNEGILTNTYYGNIIGNANTASGLSVTHYWANVAISTSSKTNTTPTFGKVTISGAYPQIQLNSTNSESSIYYLSSDGTGWATGPRAWGVRGFGIGVYNTSTDNGVKLTILDNGNTGIGTTSPQAKLHVNGKFHVYCASESSPSDDLFASSFASFGEYDDDALWIGKDTSHSIWLQSAYKNPSTAKYKLLLNPLGGNVGVSTSSPSVGFHANCDTVLGSKSLYYQRSTRGAIHHEFVGNDADYGAVKITHNATEGGGGPGGFTASLAVFDARPDTISGSYEPTFYINRTGATRVPDLLGINVGGTRVFTVQSDGIAIQANNNSWLSPAILQIGRNNTSGYSDRAVIGVTDGNLHIDCYNNSGTYLNYYSHGNIYFNGSSYYINSDGSYYNGKSALSNKAYSLLTNDTAQSADACYDATQGLHFYRFNGTGNTIGGGDGWIIQWSWSQGSVGGQIYVDDNPSGIIGIRGCNGSSGTTPTGFTSWWRIYTDAYHPSADNADKLDGYHASSFSLSTHTHTFNLGNTTITTNGGSYSGITGPFNIYTNANAANAFSIWRSSASEGVQHWVDDGQYHIDYTNDETSSSIHIRIINTDTESGNKTNTTDYHYYLDCYGNFHPGSNNTGSIGTAGYKWANMYATTFHGSLDGNAATATSATSATQATNLTPENTAHYFRDPNNSTWRGGMIWGSAGSEAMSFVVANSGTRFQFVGGSDIANWNSGTWQSVNPYLTIYSSGIVTPGSTTASGGFIKSGYDNNYVLLAGGGHKLESNLSVSYADSAGSAGSVTVNSSDSNSTYRMVWHSGNTLYGTGGIYCNPYTDYLYATSMNTSDWFRSTGSTGWYNESYGGGIYMSDSTYVRVYNDKRFYNSNTSQYAFYTSGGITVGSHLWGTSAASTWIDGQRYDRAVINVTNSTDANSFWPLIRWTSSSQGRWDTIGVLGNNLYFMSSATSKTDNGYDTAAYFDMTTSRLYSNGLYHTSYGSSEYALTSDGGAARISSMSVNYANSAGDADTIDNKHVTDFYKSGCAYPYGKFDKQWHKVASFTQSISGVQINTGITFYVGEFYLSRTYGILNIQIRNEAGYVNPEFCYVVWSLNNGIDPNDFVVGHSYSGNTVTYNLYARRNGWSSYNIRKIAEQAWGVDQDVWTCYDAVNGNSNCFASIPESNKYTSSNLTISNPTNWNSIIGKPFNWSGQSGQPSWLWGSNDGTNYYVWNPSNFSVNYANSAGSAGSANGLASTGYGNSNLTYYQTSDSFFGNSGWCHYIIANHGDGSSYYNFTIGLPFWGVPIYKRLEGGTGDGWHTFITSENIGSQSVSYADSAGSAARATFGDSSNGTHDANSITSNGLWYYSSNGPATSLGATTSDGALYSQAYSTSWVGQIAQDYRNGRLFVRGKNNGSWTSWLRVALYSEIPASVSVDYTIWRDSSSNVDYKIQVVSSLPSSTNSNTFYVIV